MTDLDLCRQYQSGDQSAASVLLKRHGGLICAVMGAMHLPPWASHDDLRQEGRLAILKAATLFRDQGTKFSTYATTAIQNTLRGALHVDNQWNDRNRPDTNAVDVARTVPTESLPIDLIDTLPALQRLTIRRIYGFDGESVTSYELAESLGVTPHYVQRLHDEA